MKKRMIGMSVLVLMVLLAFSSCGAVKTPYMVKNSAAYYRKGDQIYVSFKVNNPTKDIYYQHVDQYDSLQHRVDDQWQMVELTEAEKNFRKLALFAPEMELLPANAETEVAESLSKYQLTEGESYRLLVRATTDEHDSNDSGLALELNFTYPLDALTIVNADGSTRTVRLEARAQ